VLKKGLVRPSKTIARIFVFSTNADRSLLNNTSFLIDSRTCIPHVLPFHPQRLPEHSLFLNCPHGCERGVCKDKKQGENRVKDHCQFDFQCQYCEDRHTHQFYVGGNYENERKIIPTLEQPKIKDDDFEQLNKDIKENNQYVRELNKEIKKFNFKLFNTFFKDIFFNRDVATSIFLSFDENNLIFLFLNNNLFSEVSFISLTNLIP
jgi:hypothetical protein